MQKIGRYELIREIGKGGMGEVLLARDPACDRLVALKKIRADLVDKKRIRDRFLREARIAAQLTHPAIIPIYTIHEDGDETFYTMPYIEGETLRALLKRNRQEEKKNSPSKSSIPALIRIFFSVCQAVSYAHSKGILHRDVKPENIIIGKYGEVLILDWGLAHFIGKEEENGEASLEVFSSSSEITRPGKIPGTLSYLSPERARGERATTHSDIYSLGVILYEMLTLHLPFHRASLADYKKTMHREELEDPAEVAPYRDIPLQLSDIAKKCLSFKKESRYSSVQALLSDLENYIEGRPQWVPAAELQISTKGDWEFQENVLLAKHIAISRTPEVMEWVNLMISNSSFGGNIKIETTVRLREEGKGIGILLCVPEARERLGLADGYMLWIGAEGEAESKLFHSNIEVMRILDAQLKKGEAYQIGIEKFENHLRFSLNGALKCNYISHLPLMGTHVGILLRDANIDVEGIKIAVGSQNILVNCLAVPDAFLACKQYGKALTEYRRIGNSFLGRAEGREALFRAGITLLEEAEGELKKRRKDLLFSCALEEFGKLRSTPGAPLEYLGKSLVYKALGDSGDEVNCLELSVRKYPHHPLLPILIEHITFRMHEYAYRDRTAAYRFALLALRHLPVIFTGEENKRLLETLEKSMEPLPFLEEGKELTPIRLAFWLAKPITLVEILENGADEETKKNCLYALLYLGCKTWVKENLCAEKEVLQAALECKKNIKKALALKERRALFYVFETALDTGRGRDLLPFFKERKEKAFDPYHIWALLLEKKWEEARAIFESYPVELMAQEDSPFYFLFGCFLWATEGESIARAHFSGVSPKTFPPTPALLAHYLTGKIDLKKGWILHAFYWEKLQLLRQLVLFSHCGNWRELKRFKALLKQHLRETT